MPPTLQALRALGTGSVSVGDRDQRNVGKSHAVAPPVLVGVLNWMRYDAMVWFLGVDAAVGEVTDRCL